MEPDLLRAGVAAYGSSCEVVHVNDSSYHAYKPRRSENRIMSSFITSLEDQIRPQGLGLKYAAEGQEDYWLEKKRYSVAAGKYLLVNESIPSFDVAIQRAPTWSICVDIDAVLVNDVLQQLLQPDELDNYDKVSRYLLSPELFVREATAGKPLQDLLNYIIVSSASQRIERPPIEYIYELTALLVQGNLETINSYYKLQTAKLSTRKELFQRLLLGKDVLDDSLFTGTSIKDVADTCCMSEFRFYRLFKQCFGDSPYNYLFKKRIDKSIELKKQGLSWVDIAYHLNFTDLAAFSKSFKKIKGVSPSRVAAV